MAVDSFDWKRVSNEHLTTATEAAGSRFEIVSDADPKELDKAVFRTTNRMSATDFNERAEHFNEKAEHEQKTQQDQKDFDEKLKREARREDAKATGQSNRFGEKVAKDDPDQTEAEQELARKNQQQRQQEQTRTHSHGF
jgi:hypothetical protein